MASVRTRAKSQAKKKPAKSAKSGKIHQLFSSQKTKQPRDFSSSFEYGNVAINIKNKEGLVKCNINVESKNFNFSGVLTLNEKSFSELHDLANQLVSGIRHIKS